MTNPFDAFFEACLAIRDLRGSEGFMAVLEQELARETAMRKRALASAAHEYLDIATQALEFYAASDNYKARGGLPSAVAKDKGRRALRAIETISGETPDDDDLETEE